MTDESYAFHETEKERKRLARGAFYKKNGSRSRYVSLPSDNLTEKQRRELNGPVYTYDTKKPMDWSTFVSMPRDVQGIYLDRLCKEHGGRICDAAKMFGITPGGLGNYMRRTFAGWHPFEEMAGRKGVALTWIRFTHPEQFDEPEVKEPQAEEKTQQEETSCVKQPQLFRLTGGELRFTGNPADITNKLLCVLDAQGDYELTVTFRMLRPDES